MMNTNLATPAQTWPASNGRKQPSATDVFETTLAFNGHAHTLQRQKELETLVKRELATLANRPAAELETKIEGSLLRVGECLHQCEGAAAGQSLAMLLKMAAQASATAAANCQ